LTSANRASTAAPAASGTPRRRSAAANSACVRGAADSRRRQICRAIASGSASAAVPLPPRSLRARSPVPVPLWWRPSPSPPPGALGPPVLLGPPRRLAIAVAVRNGYSGRRLRTVAMPFSVRLRPTLGSGWASRLAPTPSFSLIFFSISLARSGLSRRKFLAFSLPWPS
jgi:hypothetical protein